MRGATRSAPADVISALISIHAPRAGRDFLLCNSVLADFISIHAPRAGRDSRPSSIVLRNTYFNPRAPCGARPKVSCNKCKIRYFNPRAPCGARLVPLLVFSARKVFQSTRPVRGATHGEAVKLLWNQFQSTRPVRGATRCVRFGPLAVSISIHAPRAGRDWAMTLKNAPQSKNFNPRAPCGARQQKYTKLLYTLLRQKAILRQFHAKRRLLKRFSTYKYRNTFLICSANRMGKICTLPLRTTRSLDLPEGMSACSQSARFCFRTFFPSSKTADYPALDP